MKRQILPVSDGLVQLRLLEEADLPKTLQWRNRDGIRNYFFHSDVLTFEQHQQWWQKYVPKDDDFVFVIELLEDEQYWPVGQVALYAVNWQEKTAEYGRLMVGEDRARGRGVAQRATKLVLQIGFDVLNLEEVHLEVFAHNQVARHVYERCGFHLVEELDNVVKMSVRKADFRR